MVRTCFSQVPVFIVSSESQTISTAFLRIMGGDTTPEGYTNTFRKMAEGVADGVNGVNNNDGNADYSTTLMNSLDQTQFSTRIPDQDFRQTRNRSQK